MQDIEELPVGFDADANKGRTEQYKLKQKLRKQKGKERAEKQAKQFQENDEGSDCEVDFEFSQGIPGVQKIFIKTYGCSHNVSDSEFMMGQLVDYGYELVAEMEKADLVLINSCTVKNPSQQSFVQLVEQAKNIKKPVVVAGCVPQGDRNIKEIQDVSIVGVTQIDRIVEVVEETLKGNKIQLLQKKELPTLDLPKIRKNQFIEIIPINAGCLGACTYCKTKHARGKLLSYSVDAIFSRMQQVIEEGVKEIWLTSEDTGAYGRDIGTNISILLKKLVENLPKGVMLRIGMTNPPYIMEHLHNIAIILNHPNVYSFLHIPIQSGSNSCLERMYREYTREDFDKLCDSLIEQVPEITLSTDIICGFPGETDEEFDDTYDVVQKYRFPVVNISQFYSRPGTAAAKMKKVNSKDVKSRSQKITKLLESFNRWEHLQGTEQIVYINEKEEKKNQLILIGHTKQYAKVVLPYDSKLLGSYVKLKVTKVCLWHIEGDIMEVRPEINVDPNHWKNFDNSVKTETERKVQRILKQQQEEEQEQEQQEMEKCKKKDCKCNGKNCNKQKGCCGQCKKEKQKEKQKEQEIRKYGKFREYQIWIISILIIIAGWVILQ